MTVHTFPNRVNRNIIPGLRPLTYFTAKWLGHFVSSIAKQEPLPGTSLNIGALAYTGAFTYYAYKGVKQMLTPWHDRNKWLVIDNRFKKSVTTVIKPVKISDLLKVSASQEFNDSLKAATDKAAKTAADAEAAIAYLEKLKGINLNPASLISPVEDQESNVLTDVHPASLSTGINEEIDDTIMRDSEDLSSEILKAEETVKKTTKEAKEAKAAVDKLKSNPSKDLSLEVSQKEAKSSSDKPAVKSADKKPEAKPDEDAFILTATLDRKDKPSKDETHFPIPFTNESVIFKHKVFFDSCTKGSVGAVKFSIGALGALDNLDYVFLDDTIVQSRHVKYYTGLGLWLGSLASVIGGASRTVGQIAGTIVEGATYYDSRTYGLNNLVGASAFAATSYYLYRITDFTWVKVKTKAGESHLQYKTIGKDAMKLFGSVLCGSFSLLALDNLLSGKNS